MISGSQNLFVEVMIPSPLIAMIPFCKIFVGTFMDSVPMKGILEDFTMNSMTINTHLILSKYRFHE